MNLRYVKLDLKDREKVIELRRDDKLELHLIAQRFGCGISTIYQICRVAGLTKKGKGR